MAEEYNTKQQQVIMNIIIESGDAKTFAKTALASARSGSFAPARESLAAAHEKMVSAHNYQTQLMQKEMSGESVEKSILLIHAQDHLMMTQVFLEMAEEIILLREELEM